MSRPLKTDSWIVDGSKGFESLIVQRDVPIPELGDYDCLIQIQAVSLNYRDLIIPKGLYPFPLSLPRVPCSDGAGIILATGPRVTQWRRGDRICTLFNQTHQANPITPESMNSGLGGVIDGTLRKYAVFPEYGLVRAPANLSPIEASTLSCAPLTAWNALYGLLPLKAGDVVLTQGNRGGEFGGGAVCGCGGGDGDCDDVIDGEDGEVDEDGRAAEVGGPGTMAQSLKAVRKEGVITIIGFLGGAGGKGGKKEPSILDPLVEVCTVRGILVGSRQQMKDMVRAIEVNKIRPVVDEKVFGFGFEEAYQYQWDQKHFGKVVIKVED
ncbi:hypothetical protein PABG_05423 [Paracoccidioides brasiliensis Pb03]|nr:hypothetical protein PABG_05423 [Paracoccidioides brasiliensis Pb03]